MAPPTTPDKDYSITARQAGTFMGALVVALVLGLANTLDRDDGNPNHPTRAEYDALAELVRANAAAISRDNEITSEVKEMVLTHERYSKDKVEEIAAKFSALEQWEVSHEQREEFQDRMISDCIRTLRRTQ